jgi:hypothetical protein
MPEPATGNRQLVPASTGDRKRQLYEILRTHVGPKKAINADELGEMIGVDSRAVRALIADLIVIDGHGEICANTGGEAFPKCPKGYFWASCSEDAEKYRNVLISRIEELQLRQRAAFHAQQRLPRKRNAQPALAL